jgi:RimJ/RimL family protein N-acetyltransferase
MVVIKGKRVNLVIPTKRDIEGIMKHINDPDIARWLDNLPHPYRRRHAEDYIKNYVRKGLRNDTDYNFVIFNKESSEIMGGMGIHHINRKHHNAEVGYWIGKKFWKQGYGTEALKLALNFAFGRLRLNKVYARVFSPNKASQALLKKAGFRQEGLFRKHSFKHGRFHDEVRFGLLREEYAEQD